MGKRFLMRLLLMTALSLAGCGDSGAPLWQELDPNALELALQQATITGAPPNDILEVVGLLWKYPKAGEQSIRIRRHLDEHKREIYLVDATFERVPDDDSVAGYRYFARLRKAGTNVWHVLSARESWNCWEDRGHTTFSTAPCH